MRELREAIWDQLPPDALPERFAERRALLLSAAAALAPPAGTGSNPDLAPPAGTGSRPALAPPAGTAAPHQPEPRSDAALRVLDVGCGAGHFAEALLATGAHVVAVDAARGALARTAERAPRAERVLWDDEAAPLAVPTESIDLIWAGETIEHVGDGEAWLGELHRVLAPGGRLLLTTPDHPFLLRLRLALSRRAFDEHVAPWQDHLRFFSAASLRELLDRAGFADIEITRAFGRRWARETLVATARRA